MMDSKELIRVENVSKTFPGVKALNNVNFSVNEGEVHGLVGENGAGKSTLIKVLTGAHKMDEGGQIYWKSQPVELTNPNDAKKTGIGAVYQEIMMAAHLTVGENFFLGHLPKKAGVVDWKEVNSVTQKVLDDLNIPVKANEKVKDLSMAMQEMVSIAQVVYNKAELIIFDEPTALLTNEDVELLMSLIEKLKGMGCGIIYISHRMEEIFDMCDRVTVLKDGSYVDTVNVEDTNNDELVSMMVGRSLVDQYNIKRFEPGDVRLEVKGLTSDKFEDINFQVRKGEILGFYGLVGSGRTEIMRAITGVDKFDSGEIYLDSNKVDIKSPGDSSEKGIAFLTETRKLDGLGMSLSVEHNINLASYKKINKFGVIDVKKEKERAEKYIKEVGIKTPTRLQRVNNLSGGNQQKVVVSKWLACESEIFIFDEPTVGVDVGARREIYLIIEELIANGAAVILISSYLPEVMGLSDRIIVMYEGHMTGEIMREEYENDMDESRFLKLASGII